ncbi:ArsC/Spx/MgsR family protein [Oscillatoria sp. FACHB-1406]|uniref:ArsC/Spx/MgsR family protein n=1 Tax=Oscillatoria sp. FACHB-1406 TaxID=2692846 RepID=UPI001686689D|nr:ArsC/Spx/MgsR family protein [Oscillatoria sp. FACHB-1406]MBD2577777.1 hypothetical protein [Oscillatoria sp. FACHB-1406]
MVSVIFYEKPGCINNTKQKALLVAAGHEVIAFSLLDRDWHPEELRPFFGSLPVREWFNPTAFAIKSGAIAPAQLDEETALALMRAEPLLIRRPLIQVGEQYRVGFDPVAIDRWLGLSPVRPPAGDWETCPRSNQTTPKLPDLTSSLEPR